MGGRLGMSRWGGRLGMSRWDGRLGMSRSGGMSRWWEAGMSMWVEGWG